MAPIREGLIWASRNAWLREHLPSLPVIRRAVRRFLPGETLEAALQAAAELRAHGIASVLTELGESVTTVEEAAAAAQNYGTVLDRVAANGLDAEVSVKPTHLGVNLGTDVAYRNLAGIVERAAAHRNYVWIDMEESRYVDVTLEMHRRARASYPRVGVCVQAYLLRTADDLESLLRAGTGIRLVKGAYAESPRMAYAKKKDVDANFLRLAKRMLEARKGDGVRPAFATHDERIVADILALARTLNLPSDAFEFQLLYGIRRDLQIRLTQGGHKVRVLISYGSAWYAWYVRRLAERPANIVFVLKNLFG
ncbi:MAG: proline dehydrogenase family protein [Gemmatimonadetes bacterium]|nr:proline dehydrogenase family protein [Gemmatimonadota bacterium]